MIDAGDLRRPTVWLFGNEAHGLPAAVIEAADRTVRVPIYGRAESLNLAATAAVCLYASARAQRDAETAQRPALLDSKAIAIPSSSKGTHVWRQHVLRPQTGRRARPGGVAGRVDAAIQAFTAAADLDELKAANTAHLGDRSPLALANREIGALPPQAKADAGKRINAARTEARDAYARRLAELEAERDARVLVEEAVDVTLPWDRELTGARHPLTTDHGAGGRRLHRDGVGGRRRARGRGGVVQLRCAQYRRRPSGPQPDGHLLRPGQDGSADSGLVLRTHTSPVQARVMLTREPPIYVVCPGKVFRTDELDATHSPVFHQLEGLVVDKGITMAHLKGTLDHMAEAFFGPASSPDCARPTSRSPSRAPNRICSASSAAEPRSAIPGPPCRTCNSEGWIEWGGCGMVNPRVLRACGIDPDVYSGFAFGMGIERTMMFRNNAADMRDIIEGDVRFTQAFGTEA